jgi:lysyl-tRNA synthetase class 2
MEQNFNEQQLFRRQKLDDLKSCGFTYNSINANLVNTSLTLSVSYPGQKITVAGRIKAKRGQGKIVFIDLSRDLFETQVVFSRDEIGEDRLNFVKSLDIGDIILVCGDTYVTNSGQKSVKAKSVNILVKCLSPLASKNSGLTNKELKYRNRPLDLITNKNSFNTFRNRSAIISRIRDTLNLENFLEIETPILQSIPGGAAARPFDTHHNSLGIDMYLRVSPELYLKRAIIGGFERVYEIGKNFRNEGLSTKHNPEFTMLEAYCAYSDVEYMKNLCISIIHLLTDMRQNFRVVNMTDLVNKKIGIDIWKLDTNLLSFDGICFESHSEALVYLFEQYCESELTGWTFVGGHPSKTSPLALPSQKDTRFAERYELYFNSMEIANMYSELNDPDAQRKNFEAQGFVDEDYISALEYGLPPTSGLGIGIDRLVMVLLELDNIRDSILFPTMRSQNA